MIKTILFDLDGTIVNTNELIIASFLHALEGQTPQPVGREHIVPNMGRPLVEQMRYFSGREQVDDLVNVYREYNVRRHDELVEEFPYVREVLAGLHASGIRMGVVTSKIRLTTEMGLKLLGLNEYLDTIVTVEDVAEPKPSPEGILRAMGELGAERTSTLMVGDSQYDILAAQNAGVKAAGVAWTLKGEAFLQGYKPDYMLHDMRELLAIAGVKADGV
ncbi:pyrophosphatase PpaX [Paenibacillus sp. MBLB4367]|uniref:pyrophosphatase PpaX n=1 Tax=Paenibacillus sp. MBLB4367 TaxID=3384767 RepID=UPI003907ECD4